ncbi:hypothetical protein AB9G26_03340 [Francisella philomiragia]|uniref:hypothetical protein n=1 Tax=Francisella philomiragia TaxID=28110 RepID=UPI003513C922
MLILKKNTQKGVALIFALAISVIILLMTFLLFALSHSNLTLIKHQKKKLENDASLQEVFDSNILSSSNSSDFNYDTNTLPLSNTTENLALSDGVQYSLEKSNSSINNSQNTRFDSFIEPENGYTMRVIDYYVKMSLENNEKNITIKVPSDTHVSQDSSIDRSSISLNIPAINFNNLYTSQLDSGSSTFIDTKVGYVGNLVVDNTNYRVTFTDTNGVSNSLDLPNTFNSGSFALSQGWYLNDGSWEISIGVYDPDTTNGCVIKAPLVDLLSDISTLVCVSLDAKDVDEDGARYPNPTNYPVCVKNERYPFGHICQEDGILFIADKNNARALPFQRSGDWRVYYPSSDWVAPYTQGARYSDGDLVAYDGIVFRSTQNNQNRDPFSDNDWRVNGIYVWNDKVRYLSGDIVTFNGDFYQARRTNEGNSDSPTDTRDWTNIGSTLEQSNINQLPQQAQANVSAGTTVNDYQPINIVFPYRDESPSQAQLNCEGEYPPINTNTFSQCIDGQVYNTGDTCYENNMLFTAQDYTTDSPFNRPNEWRLDIPTEADTGLDWVVPYSNNVMYVDNVTRVIYDGRRFTNSYWINEGTTPYESHSWIVDGIYGWHEDIQYRVNEVVIRDGNFYRANGWNKDSDPLTNSTNFWDDWENLGSTYNNQTAEEALNSCGASNINNVVVQFNLGDNLFRDRNGNGDYLTTDMQNLPNGFGLYGDSNPTTVSYTLSGSLFDAASLIYVTDENGWVPLYNPDAQGETLVRDWGDKNATIFINTDYGNIPSGDYDLTIDLEYSLNEQTYQGSSSYSITI